MGKGKINGNKLRSAETKRKILQCAEELFKEIGINQVSIEAIVKKAGVSKGTFYVHFNSKDALIAHLASDYARKLDVNYRSFLAPNLQNASICDVLRSLVEEISDCITNKIGYVLMMNIYRIQLDGTVTTDSILNYSRDIYKIFRELLVMGIQTGEFRQDLVIDRVAFQLVTSIRGLTYEWLIRYPELNLKESLLECFTLLLKGLQ